MSDADANDITMGPGSFDRIKPAPLTDQYRGFLKHEEARRLHIYVPPGDNSGATTGWGYDFGQHTAEQITRTWGPYIGSPLLSLLTPLAGKRGDVARAAAARLSGVLLPGPAVDAVFELDSVPEYQRVLDRAFTPAWRLMHAAVQWALFSLAYNSGGVPLESKTGESAEGESTDTDKYDFKRALRAAVEERNAPAIVQILRDAGRDDDPTGPWAGDAPPNPVLRARRRREADLAESSYPSGNRA